MLKGGMGNLMKQAQQMQEQLQKAQQELAHMEVIGEAGGALVQITMTGRHDVRRVRIDPSLLDDPQMLEDLIAAAVNDAVQKIEAGTKDKYAGMAGGLNLPPGFKLPF